MLLIVRFRPISGFLESKYVSKTGDLETKSVR